MNCKSYIGLWFGTCVIFLLGIIIPTDYIIFFRGVAHKVFGSSRPSQRIVRGVRAAITLAGLVIALPAGFNSLFWRTVWG